jgi:hypothetical protein
LRGCRCGIGMGCGGCAGGEIAGGAVRGWLMVRSDSGLGASGRERIGTDRGVRFGGSGWEAWADAAAAGDWALCGRGRLGRRCGALVGGGVADSGGGNGHGSDGGGSTEPAREGRLGAGWDRTGGVD